MYQPWFFSFHHSIFMGALRAILSFYVIGQKRIDPLFQINLLINQVY